MSKRFFLSLIAACILLSTGLIFFYHSQVVSSKTVRTFSREEIKKMSETVNQLPPTPTSTSFTLLAVGDIMLDRSVFLKTKATGDWNHPFLLIDPLFQEYDLHLANLEGPITTFPSVANGTGGARFTFTFSPNFVSPLQNRFDFLSLANNHAHNFGQNGLEQTRKYLGDAEIRYFGSPENTPGYVSVTSSYEGITLGFIGYHELVQKGFDTVLSEAKKLDSTVDVLIAMPHWGVEYVTDKPTLLQTQEAHELIDAGVDVIFGAHPHVVEPVEIYKNKVIFYSLGNFVFDQYFSSETMTGLAVGMQIEKKEQKLSIGYKLIPLDINTQSQPSVAESEKRLRVLDEVSRYSNVAAEIKEQMKEGKLEL